jgi:hypothetical protein
MTKSINFTATKNTVTADKYVPYALYTQNKAIVEKLGGQVCKGNEGFVAQFPTAAKAKAFVSQAICSMSKKEYNATRKTAPAPKSIASAPKQGKGKTKAEKFITLMDEDGNEYKIPMSALGIVSAPAPKKSKAKATTKKATTTKKAVAPKTKPVAKGKGKSKSCGVDFSKLAGKGRAANAKASALINKAGYANNTPEYMAAWAVWCEVR